jgi:hypothetical protein
MEPVAERVADHLVRTRCAANASASSTSPRSTVRFKTKKPLRLVSPLFIRRGQQ